MLASHRAWAYNLFMAPSLLDAPVRPPQAEQHLSEAADHLLYAEEFERIAATIGPCELIDGVIHELPMNKAIHSELVIQIGGVLKTFVRDKGLGRVLGGEVGIYTSFNPTRARAADLAFISHERLPELPAKGFSSRDARTPG